MNPLLMGLGRLIGPLHPLISETMYDPGEEEAGILFELVRRRYGGRLSSEELEEVKRGVERILELSAEMRSVKLNNWDEPPLIFRPYRGDGEDAP